MRVPLPHANAAVLHGVDDVFFHQCPGNAQALGDLRVGQAFELAQQEALAAQRWQLGQGTLDRKSVV